MEDLISKFEDMSFEETDEIELLRQQLKSNSIIDKSIKGSIGCDVDELCDSLTNLDIGGRRNILNQLKPIIYHILLQVHPECSPQYGFIPHYGDAF